MSYFALKKCYVRDFLGGPVVNPGVRELRSHVPSVTAKKFFLKSKKCNVNVRIQRSVVNPMEETQLENTFRETYSTDSPFSPFSSPSRPASCPVAGLPCGRSVQQKLNSLGLMLISRARCLSPSLSGPQMLIPLVLDRGCLINLRIL